MHWKDKFSEGKRSISLLQPSWYPEGQNLPRGWPLSGLTVPLDPGWCSNALCPQCPSSTGTCTDTHLSFQLSITGRNCKAHSSPSLQEIQLSPPRARPHSSFELCPNSYRVLFLNSQFHCVLKFRTQSPSLKVRITQICRIPSVSWPLKWEEENISHRHKRKVHQLISQCLTVLHQLPNNSSPC